MACGELAAEADEAARAASAVPQLLDRVLAIGRANDFYFEVRMPGRGVPAPYVPEAPSPCFGFP